MEISKEAIQDFLRQQFGKYARLQNIEKLGTGWHGLGSRVTFTIKGEKRKVVLRTINSIGFGHDGPWDRAKVLISQHQHSKIPNHIHSLGIGGINGNQSLSVGDCSEFFQIVEEVEGNWYTDDLNRMDQGNFLPEDLKKAEILAEYLVELHSQQFKGDPDIAKSLRLRHTRDCIGQSEMLMGVLDTYPEKVTFATKQDLLNLVKAAIDFRAKMPEPRLVRMHGDFHPGNIVWEGEKLTVLDASRFHWGDPADDVTCLAINYLWRGIVGEPQKMYHKLFKTFWDRYQAIRKDPTLEKIAPLFFAFRTSVVCHPVFYPNQSDATRKKMLDFAMTCLRDEQFYPDNLQRYFE